MTSTPDDDGRRIAIWQLQQTLTALHLQAEVAESEPLLVVAGNPKDGTRALAVRCDPRPAAGGRLWFWIDPGPGRSRANAMKPLVEADRLADAVVHIRGERKLRA
jgi:hypothetical protein